MEKNSWEIAPSEVDSNQNYQLVDIREADEVSSDPYLKGPYLHMPMSCFDRTALDPTLTYALFCQRGRRSASLVDSLRKAQITNVFSVLGGIEALKSKSC